MRGFPPEKALAPHFQNINKLHLHDKRTYHSQDTTFRNNDADDNCKQYGTAEKRWLRIH